MKENKKLDLLKIPNNNLRTVKPYRDTAKSSGRKERKKVALTRELSFTGAAVIGEHYKYCTSETRYYRFTPYISCEVDWWACEHEWIIFFLDFRARSSETYADYLLIILALILGTTRSSTDNRTDGRTFLLHFVSYPLFDRVRCSPFNAQDDFIGASTEKP